MSKEKGSGYTLAVIPARAGSKGVPGKNTKKIRGKPLIVYAIEAAQTAQSRGLIDRFIVSTDSSEIRDLSISHGAEAPFLRPAELAQDTTPMLPVLRHAIEEMETRTKKPIESVVLLDPTAPLREIRDIEEALKSFRSGKYDAVVSGHRSHRSPYFNLIKLNDEGYAEIFALPPNAKKPIGRRQDAPPTFDLNTVVWVFSRKCILELGERIPKKTGFIEIPVERAIDLDTPLDFELLEFMLSRKPFPERP